VADLYDMIHPNASDTATVRSVFIIGPDKKVKLTLTYPPPPAACERDPPGPRLAAADRRLPGGHPANWQEGEDVIIVPAVSDEDAKTKFPKGFTALKPYLRTTPQPNL